MELDIVDPFKTSDESTASGSGIVDPFAAPATQLKPPPSHSALANIGHAFYGNLASGAGQIVQGIGDIKHHVEAFAQREDAAHPVLRRIDNALGFTPENAEASGSSTIAAGKAMQGYGNRIASNVDPNSKLAEVAGTIGNFIPATLGTLGATALGTLVGGPPGGAAAGVAAGSSLFGAQGEAGGRNAGEQQVASLSDQQLAQIPQYQKYLQSGMSPTDARAQFSADVANRQAEVGGGIGAALGVVGEIPGVGATGRFVTGKLTRTIGARAAQAIGKGVAEGAGFAGVNAAGQVASNVANQIPTPALQGVGESAAAGLLPGFILGGARGVLTRPAPAGPLGRAADTAHATGAAAPEPFPGAAPGTLSDAANTLHRTVPEASTEPSPTAVPPESQPTITRRMPPPAVPWVDAETGEQRTPTATEVVAAFHGMQDQQAQAAANNVKLVTGLRQLSEAWGVPLERLKSLSNVAANERAKGVTTADAQQRAAEDLAQQQATEARQQADRDLFSPSAQENAAPTAADASAAGIPFMITNAMRADLAARGYDRDAIARMTPQEAHAALNAPSDTSVEAPAATPTGPEDDAAASAARAEPVRADAAAAGAARSVQAEPLPEAASSEPPTAAPADQGAGEQPALSGPASAPADRAIAADQVPSSEPSKQPVAAETTQSADENQGTEAKQSEDAAQAAAAGASAKADENAAPPVQPERVVKASVPLGAGMSADGKTLYVDHRIPETLDVPRDDGTTAKVRLYNPGQPGEGGLPVHEGNEFPQMLRGKKYQDAHDENANAAEDAYYQQKYGVSRAAVDKALKPYLDAAREQGAGAKDIPADLDRTPYTDGGDVGLLAPDGAKTAGPTHEPTAAKPDARGAVSEAEVPQPSAPAKRGEPNAPTFPLRQVGTKGLVVQGIRDDVRAALRAGGFKKPGTAAKDGVRFDATDRPAIERALGTNVAAGEVAAAAKESAAHPDNERPEPTPAQHEAGNFKMGHVNLHGMHVTIEVPKGGVRRGTDRTGKPWERAASDHYGYVRRTEGADGEQVDVYLGPHAEDPKSNVFVIDQVKPGTKTFDEHKAMVGFKTGREARASYDANFPKGMKTFGGIRKMSMDEFKGWVKQGDTTKPISEPMQAAAAAHKAREQAVEAVVAPGDRVTVTMGTHAGKPATVVGRTRGGVRLKFEDGTQSTLSAKVMKRIDAKAPAPRTPTAAPAKAGVEEPKPRYAAEQADLGKSNTTYGNISRIREPTPEGTAPDGAGRGRRDAVSGGTLDLFAPQGDRKAVQAARAAAPKLTQRAALVKTGLFKSGISRIRDWKDAAHIIAPIRKSPQEHMMAVVADADGKPLAVLRHTVGLKASSQVDPVTVAGAVAQIPGARQVWFAHNHPSGELDQSGADRAITARLHDTLRGSGIEPRGMIVVGPGEKRASFYHPEHANDIDGSRRGGTDSAQPITAASRTAEVPMVERQFRKIAQGPRVRITDPNGMADAVRDVAHGETGVMLLDNRHHVIGFLPMSDAEMAKLRTDDPATGAARVLRTSSEANASASIPVVHDVEAGKNVNRLLAGTGSVEPERQNIRPLDIAVLQPNGAVESAVSAGRRPLKDESFFSRGGQSTGKPLARDQVQKLVDATTAKWGDNQPKVRVLADAEGLPASDKTTEGYYDPKTGTAYLIASNLRSPRRVLEVLAHEAIGHHGIENVVNDAFGPDAMQKITDAIQRLDKGDRASTTMRALLDETHRRYDRDGQPPDPTTFAREFLAISAEKGARNVFLDRVMTAIRKFLRQIMPNLQINERDLRGLLAQGDRFVREETPYRERVAQKAAMAFSKPDDQTKTEAFRNFFGDSKVVDTAGDPRPVFHGTSEGFYTFDDKKLGESTAHMTAPLGHFFAEDRGSAARYAENASRGVTADERVVDAYLNIRKPFNMSTKDLLEIDSPDEARSMKRQLEARGYDGIHITDAKQWVAFKPEQIKSASENRGTFDRANPDIRSSRPEPASPENPADPSREPHRAVAAIESAIQSTAAKDAWTEMAKEWMRGRFEDARPWLLKVAPLDRLVELAQEVEPLKVGATQFARSAKQMATDREHLLTGAPDAKDHPHDMLQRGVSPLAEELRAFAYGKGIGAFRGEIRPEAKRTFRLMHEATVAGVYLDRPYERLKIQNARGDRVEWTPDLRKERLGLMDELAMQRGGDPDSNREKLREEKKYLRALPRLEAEHKAAYDRLKPQFDALPDEAKRNWRQTRDWFQQFRDEVEKTAIKRIERATPDEGSRRAAVEAMRLMYEEARVDGVYFPLARHGNYWIAYTTKDGKSGFEMQEDANAQHKRERQLRAAGNRIDATGLRTKNAKAKEAPSGTFVRKAMDMLARNGVSEATRDDLYQLYLQMLPEMSMRKHAIHRDNVIGWSEDVPRTFADNGFHGAYQLARMRHSQDMELALEAAGIALDNWRKSNDRFPGSSAPQLERFMSDTLDRYDADPGAAQAAAAKVDSGGLALAIDDIARRIASEKTGKQARVESEVWNGLAKRWSALPDNVRRAYTLEAMQQFGLHGEHSTFDVAKADTLLGALKNNLDWVMNPEDAKWANKVTQLGFVYYLGMNPASALTNLTQIAQTTLPVLGAEHGWPKASRMVGAAWRDAARTLGHMDKTLTDPDEKRAFLLMQKRGDFSKTQGHTLAALAEGNRLRSAPAWAKVADLVSYLFHTSEVINREATGMAAFRLARSKGMDFEKAIDYAGRINASTQFDYSAQNRAPIMRGNVGRIAFQFKNFAIQQSFLVGRNMWLATRGETPEVRRLARRTTAGILGMTALLAGVTGLPTYNVVSATLNAVNAMFGDDNEPWNFDDAFHRWLADNLGPDAARLIAEGPTNYLTGANLASRTSLSNLWMHDNNQRLEGADAYHALLESLAGPVFGGIVPNLYTGTEDVRRGYVWRGVERMLPAAAKNSMKALRYAHEGVNSLRGDPIVPDVSGYQDFLQAIGFQPATVANQYRINTAMRNYTGEIQDRRMNLMNAYALAVKSGDPDDRGAAVRKINAFNQAHPQVAITVKTLSASLRARARLSAQARNGVVLNRKLALQAQQYAGAQ